MQLINAPAKLVLPFANAGAKNTIPTASQIGIVAGAASLTDGFPPLTRTPIAAGGVPPSGLDMNGILYELSAILRWANAGGGYAYDAAFATDSNVGGYPKGARIMRSDGLGYWFNTVENNTTDPEAAGAAAAGWVPDFTNGVTAVTMTSANVTLTPLQYGKPIIVITGTLTANLNLIFPAIVNEWTVINNTTGAFTITCKTASGTGLVVNTAALIVGDGTNIQAANNDSSALLGANVASAGGTADALTVTLASTVRSWAQIAGIPFWVRAASANATTTPTVAVNGLAAKTEVKGAGSALAAGDHAGAGHWLLMQYDATLDKVVLMNPATGVATVTTLPEVPVRQTVLGGPVDSSGLPSFLPATSASLSVTSQNIAAGAPFVVASANGFNGTGAVDRIGQSTANLTWSGLTANTTNYLYVDVAANGALTPGSATLAPVYQFGGARNTVNGQATYNIQEASMTVGNGSTANQAYRVFVGEAVTNASTVTSTVAYAYQGKYDSGWFAANANSIYSKNHNLGVNATDITVWANSVASDDDKNQADTSGGFTASASFNGGAFKSLTNRNAMAFRTGSIAIFYSIAGGSSAQVTNGYLRAIIKRSW